MSQVSHIQTQNVLTDPVNSAIFKLTSSVNEGGSELNEKFFELPIEKQENIINAAMMVFGKNEYRKATTDEIVKLAGISKGLLFHYFHNKRELYLYLYDYMEQTLLEEMQKEYDYDETDFFQMLTKAQMCKLRIRARHPGLFDFLTRAYMEKNDAVEKKMDVKFRKIIDASSQAFLKRADCEKFKDGITVSQVLNIVIWLSEGFMRSKEAEAYTDIEKVNEEFLEYMELLRRHFYKEEYV